VTRYAVGIFLCPPVGLKSNWESRFMAEISNRLRYITIISQSRPQALDVRQVWEKCVRTVYRSDARCKSPRIQGDHELCFGFQELEMTRHVLVLELVMLTVAPAMVAAEAETREAKVTEVVRESFREVHGGFSADEVLVRDDLNAAFIARCRKSLPDADETRLNWTLLNMRKAGRLDVPATRRTVLRHDEYLHAAEIAARLMYDKYELSTDRVLCDPRRRQEFDEAAQAVFPGASAYRLRRAALYLRKARRLRPELVLRVAQWDKKVVTISADAAARDAKRVPESPGVYIFRDSTGYLYIGESANLRRRITDHLDDSDRKSLAHYFHRSGIRAVTLELHVFDPDSEAKLTSMRRAYESELIRSRKPRLNIAP